MIEIVLSECHHPSRAKGFAFYGILPNAFGTSQPDDRGELTLNLKFLFILLRDCFVAGARTVPQGFSQ